MASIASDGLFSVLPDEILHQILHSLTLRHRTIASLVSKKWRHMITSFDDDGKFVQKRSTDRYCADCNNGHNHSSCHHCSDLHPIIKLAADNSLTEFYLSLPSDSYFYRFSLAILESRLLTVLHLRNCNIIDYFHDIEELPSLKEIYFDHVTLSSEYFSMLINKCPSIVELTLIYSVYSISLPDLKQLKKVHVSDNRIRAIEIAARNLQEFHLFSTDSPLLKLDLRACTKLQVLEIDCEYIPVGFPEEFFSAFPHLKSLFLHLCRRLNKIKLLSHELENLTLSHMVDLQDAIIVTPNLRSLKLIDAKRVPRSSPVVGSRLTEAEIGHVYAVNRLPDLRTFAENLGENMTLSLATESKEARFHFGNRRSNIQPISIKHLNLEIPFSWLLRYESLIDELFMYFHPKTLLVRVDSNASKNSFIQILLNELKSLEKKRHKRRYKCSTYMCWRCLLKDFMVLASTTTRQGTHQLSFGFQWFE